MAGLNPPLPGIVVPMNSAGPVSFTVPNGEWKNPNGSQPLVPGPGADAFHPYLPAGVAKGIGSPVATSG